MSEHLRWDVDGQDWPLRDSSRFIEAGGLAWHVQQTGPADGAAPVVLLLHGTGASAHSWHELMPLLEDRFTLVAPDLPGHAFTRRMPASRATIEEFATAIAALLAKTGQKPALIVGHSAGAAIGLELAQREFPGVPVIGLNPALMPFPGLAAQIFPTMARLLFVNPLAPRIFAGTMRLPGEAERFLLRSTQSRVGAASRRCYTRLLGNSHHCAGALEMMAHWDLDAFSKRLPHTQSPVLLVHSDNDPAIPLSGVTAAGNLLPDCRLEVAAGGGHVAHEAKPVETAARLVRFAQAHDIVPDAEEGATA